MEIWFKTRQLQRICSESKQAIRKLGADRAKKLQQRLMELKAAVTLADVSRLPPARCHELKGDRKGQLSVDLGHPYRLVFVPADDPLPELDAGGLDWAGVTEIEIIEIEDPH